MQWTHAVKRLRVFLGPFRHLRYTSKLMIHDYTATQEKRQEYLRLHGRGTASFGSFGKSVV
jgi:hypothetical protein